MGAHRTKAARRFASPACGQAGQSRQGRPRPGRGSRAACPILLCCILIAFTPGCYLHRDPASLRAAFAVPELPETLDPHLEAHAGARYVLAALFDALTAVDERGTLRPALATSWQPFGPTAWEFKLRQGVRFANGEELTANTVAFNIRRVLRSDLESPVLRDIPTLFRSSARDRYTVVIQTRQPDPVLPRRLAALYMVPSEHMLHVAEEQFGREPVGTGPWKVRSFVPGKEVTLEARKGSWRGAPQTRTIELRQNPDASTRASALLDGTAHVALDIPVAQIDALTERGFRVYDVPVAATRLITLDTRSDEVPLANVKVRQALNYAIDKDRLLDEVVGAGVPLEGRIVGKEAYGFSDRVRSTYPYDPEMARRLMAEAGFPDGFIMRVHYPHSADEHELRELTAIARDLQGIRVRLVPERHDPALHQRRRLAGQLSPAFYETLPYYPSLDASAVMELFSVEQGQGFSPTYDNNDFWESYKLARTEMDPAIRLQALQVSMAILADFPPAIFLYQPVRVDAAEKNATDFRPSPDLLLNFDRLSR